MVGVLFGTENEPMAGLCLFCACFAPILPAQFPASCPRS